jgi:hypothetical protein
VCTAVVASQKWALEVDPKDRRVSTDFGRRKVNLGNQHLGRSRYQREQLTRDAVFEMQAPRRPDGFWTVPVRAAGTAMIVDVDQPRGEDVAVTIENFRVVGGEFPPFTASPGGEHLTVIECDEGIRAVKT